MTDHQRHEFLELVAAMREGTIDAEGIARIEALVKENSDLCRLYIEHVRLASDLQLDFNEEFVDRSLAQTLQEDPEEEPLPDSAAPTDSARGTPPILGFLGETFQMGRDTFPPMPGLMLILVIAISAILLGMVASRTFWRDDASRDIASAPTTKSDSPASPSSRLSPSKPRPYVARLTQAVDCVWAEAEKSIRSGFLLRSNERLELKKGRVEISFFDGARLVAQGPTILEPKSPDSAVLHSGTVRVRADADAIGFTLLTPRVAVVDMGTEFGVKVDAAGRANVDVFEGQVLAQVMDPSGTVHENIPITEGRAVQFDESTRIMASRPARELQEIEMGELPTGYQRWQSYSESLAQDPDMIAYYTFEGRQLEDDVLHNYSLRGSLLDGQILHGQWGEGRWPNKEALKFTTREDRVLVNIPGEYEELSLAAWIRLDPSARAPASILHADGHIWDNPGVVHWMINPRHSTHFAFVDADKRITNCFSGAAIPAPDSPRWHHFAVVCDMQAGTVNHYVDGCMAGNQEIERPRLLRIGSAQIGNSSIDKPQDDRHLSGLIDEFMVFQRALSAAEIRYMFHVGRPMD